MHTVCYQRIWGASGRLLYQSVLFFILLLSPWVGYAQEGTYRGRVLDSDGQPLEFANVVALSLPDSTVTKGTITDKGGAFSLTLSTPRERLLFRVSLMGYRTAFASPQLSVWAL